ncbi:MAG TPA: trigger factor [Spirochaetota bacterium]|nr:trigger factor [Spirochaetota bacterium]
MNILSEKKLENAVMELEIEVPVEKVELEYKAVFNKIQKNAKIDGFRPGKAPLPIIESKYSEHAGTDVAENLAKSALFEAVEQKELAPVSEPRIEYAAIKRDEPFRFTARLEVMPSVELADYKGISADEKSCSVTDQDVVNEIDTVREKTAVIEKIENADAVVGKGNLIRFKLKRIDDVEKDMIDTVEFRDYSIVVGKSRDEYTLDKHLLGLKTGVEKEIIINYPADYYISDFAGKAITYLAVVTEISTVTLPEFNDEFAVKSGYESTDDMKTKTRSYLEKFVGDKIKNESKNELILKIADKCTFDIPETMMMNEMYSIFQKTQQRIGYHAESLDQFASLLGIDPEEYRGKLKEDAVKSIRNTLLLSEVVKKEDMKVSDDKFKEVVENLAKSMQRPAEELYKMMEENNTRSNVEQDILLEMALDFIYENAKINKLGAVTLDDFVKNRM